MSHAIRSLVVLACALAAGCGGGPYYRLEWSVADAVTLLPGESVELPVTVRRVANTQGEARITLQNAPQGVTMTPSEFTIPQGQDSISVTPTLSVAADTTATLQTVSQLLLVAEDPANDFASASDVFLSLLAPPAPQPDFSLGVEPRQVELHPGQRKQVTITVTRANGFTGPLTISLETPTKRLQADALTLTGDQTTGTLYVNVDPSISPYPVATRFVATTEDGRKASTGFTFDIY